MHPLDRARLFWGVCIPVRSSLTYLAATGHASVLRIAAIPIALSWLGGREFTDEGVFGGPTWWAEQRPIHGVLWGLFAWSGHWQFLGLDTLFGALNWFHAGNGRRLASK